MLVIYNAKELEIFRNSPQLKGKTVGFVPTMGALHEGHKSLVRAAVKGNDITISSIFVNPTQFNDPEDLEAYPRTLEKDLEALACVDCDIAFVPTVDDIYPPDLDTEVRVEFGSLVTVMEGKFRSGHFKGVAQVVNRLLDITTPDRLYMGQKDFQQVAVVSHMIAGLGRSVKVIPCPIVREEDGLAMSSRNMRLDPDIRPRATILYDTLVKARKMAANGSPVSEIRQMAEDAFKIPGFTLEYFEIVDGNTLKSLKEIRREDYAVACIAAFAGEIRLIDNLVF